MIASILAGFMLMRFAASAHIPPVVNSISCGETACFSGGRLTITGSSLFDENLSAWVSLAPDFTSKPPYQAIDCPILYDFSTSTKAFCTLPDVPASYTGIPLMANVSNANGQAIIGYVKYSKAAAAVPSTPSLTGCNAINSTALDGCTLGDKFYITGFNFPNNAGGVNVLLTDGAVYNAFTCQFYDKAQTIVQCIIPAAGTWSVGPWYSVSIGLNDTTWSKAITPGIHFAPPSPNIASVSSSCDPSGCVAGMVMTITGTYLLDNSSYASVSLAPTFFGNYVPVDCPVDFDFSTSTVIYCSLPQVPASYLGMNLMVQVSNVQGDCVITGGVTYALPASSSSSSTGSRPIPPPKPSDMSSSKISTSRIMEYVVPPTVVIVALVIILVLRNRANRRRMLASGVAAPLIVNNQPAPGIPLASAAAPAAAPIYGYHYPQQAPHQQPAQYPVAQYPSVYHQYPQQPSVPSVYPQVRQYPAY